MKKNTWRFGVGVTVLIATVLFLVPLLIANVKTKLADDSSLFTIKTGYWADIISFDSNGTLTTLGAPPNYKAHDPFLLKQWEVRTGKLISSRKTTKAEEDTAFLCFPHNNVSQNAADNHHPKTTIVLPKVDYKKESLSGFVFSGQSSTLASSVSFKDRVAGREELRRGGIRAWSSTTGKAIWFADEAWFEPRYYPIAFSTHGKWLAEARKYDVVLRTASTGKIIRTIKAGLPNKLTIGLPWNRVAFSPDNRFLAATIGIASPYPTAGSGTMFVWDLKSGALRWKGYQPNMIPRSIIFSPDGSMIACPCFEEDRPGHTIGGAVIILNAGTGKQIKTLTWETAADRLALEAEVRKQTLLRKPNTGSYSSNKSRDIGSLSFSPNSKLLAASSTNEIKIWKVQ